MTIGHETFVNLETATLLKQAGFNWKCRYRFFNDVFDVEGNYSPSIDFNGTDRMPSEMSAPSLCVAQRWLREIKKLSVEMHFCFLGFAVHEWCCKIHSLINDEEIVSVYKEAYEEALEAGIKKALEIILKLEERHENKQD